MSSAEFRTRTTSSKGGGLPPPPPLSSQPYGNSSSSSRLVDADERKAMARSGSLRHAHRSFGGLKMSSGEWKVLAGVVVLALFVRLWHLNWPNSVVFDEVHFGKFAGKYILTRYYVDVHPPLAKLLITFMAVLGGFDASFDFKEIGKLYPETVPYVLMRALPALMGVGVVPIAYLTLRGLDCRPITALLGSLLVTFENGLITQSRLILLDSPLIFFTALSVLCWVLFANENHQEPFTEDWWLTLSLTGLSLGAVASCKWVGLFTVATVGLATMKQLWDLLGDLKVSPRLWMKHFLARALCLIALPIVVYMAVFEIHFMVLQNSGDGDGFMSAAFQTTLQGKGMQDTYADVSYGSEVTLRHLNTQGGYLHSHEHNYPGGSSQQQITLYPHRDNNNAWRLTHQHIEGAADHDYVNEPVTWIANHMQVRLEHVPTLKRLHSHDVRPPVSEVDFQNEVSGYGFPGFVGDANDNWIVEIEYGDSRDKASWGRLRTIGTVFRLRHALQGCYLFSHKVKLPEWGFEQQEVTCNKNAVKANSLWYIETNNHPALPADAERVNYRKPGFIKKFIELQRVMWITNAGLTDRHTYDSRPHQWLTLARGINFWSKDHRHIYLIGNPLVWWSATAAILVYLGVRALIILRAKRQYEDLNNSFVVKYDNMCAFLVIGWFIHYFPFFIMSRQLFLHHYFPALYFGILTICAVFDVLTTKLTPRTQLQVGGVIMIAVVWTWWRFSALTYAGEWTKGACESAKWRKTWDFSCDAFPATYSEYTNYPKWGTPSPSGVTPLPDGHAPHEEGDVEHLAGESGGKAAETTTHVEVIAAEPGRDIFNKDNDEVVKSASKEVPKPVEEPKHTQKADPNEAVGNKDVQPPPPLPKNELKELSTKDDVAGEAAAVPSPEPEPVKVVKEKILGGGAEKASSEEERVRKELFPGEAK